MDLKDLEDPKYLGDGLYAGHDGYQIWLIAHNGMSSLDAVALEREVAESFLNYAIKIYGQPWLEKILRRIEK